jgi:hypothetical protein
VTTPTYLGSGDASTHRRNYRPEWQLDLLPSRGRKRSSCFRRNSASPSPSGSRLSGSFSSALLTPGYRRARLSCSSRASGRSSPARTTTRPAPSSRSPAAPTPSRRVPSRQPREIRLMPARHPHRSRSAASWPAVACEGHTVGTWSQAGRRFGESASARCSTGCWTGCAWVRAILVRRGEAGIGYSALRPARQCR